MCTQLNSQFTLIFLIFMGFGLLPLLSRAMLIVRLKQLDITTYTELGCPSFSDLFGTKAGRALLRFLWNGKFRAYEDRALQNSAWLTIILLLIGELGLIGVLVAEAYCWHYPY